MCFNAQSPAGILISKVVDTLFLYLKFISCVCEGEMCVCVRACGCHGPCVKVGGKLQFSLSSNPEDKTQVLKLGGRTLHPQII